MSGLPMIRRSAILGPVLGAALIANPAAAQEAGVPVFDLSADLTVDTVMLASGGADAKPRVLTNLDLMADADLGQLAGWRGARVHVHVIDNRGARPNDVAGTLEGIDNIEVPAAGTRLFEAWIEQDLPGGASLLAGLYDVNGEFYVSEAASLLLAPPFGIGSEFAATGNNGPSIFPSTSLGVRLRIPFDGDRGRLQLAALNANARTIGDSSGIDFAFRDGLLLVGEAGMGFGPVTLGLGAWHYTKSLDDPLAAANNPLPSQRHSQGTYAMIEVRLLDQQERSLDWFARAGVSEGRLGPFSGGYQTGFTLTPTLAGRPHSGVSVGVRQAWISLPLRQELQADGVLAARAERAFAWTFADQLFPGFGLQGEMQWVQNAGGNTAARDMIVTTLRATISL